MNHKRARPRRVLLTRRGPFESTPNTEVIRVISMPETSPEGSTPTPCAGVPTDAFYPAVDGRIPSRPTPTERAALLICGTCPAATRKQCLRDALTWPIGDQHGVVGGTTASQRRAILWGAKVAQQLAEVA